MGGWEVGISYVVIATLVVEVAILVIGIIGFKLGVDVIRRLRQQIGTLEGTVNAQAETLKTLGELNKTALEMARAFDPKKYADMVNTHQELAERIAASTVEDARRTMQREHEQAQEQSKREVEVAMGLYESAMERYEHATKLGLDLVAYVPPERRRISVASANVPDHMKELFLRMAERAPDLSRSPLEPYNASLQLLKVPVLPMHLEMVPEYQCAACHQRFELGEAHTLVPLGPGNNPEARTKARAGARYESYAAVPVHWACATGQE